MKETLVYLLLWWPTFNETVQDDGSNLVGSFYEFFYFILLIPILRKRITAAITVIIAKSWWWLIITSWLFPKEQGIYMNPHYNPALPLCWHHLYIFIYIRFYICKCKMKRPFILLSWHFFSLDKHTSPRFWPLLSLVLATQRPVAMGEIPELAMRKGSTLVSMLKAITVAIEITQVFCHQSLITDK